MSRLEWKQTFRNRHSRRKLPNRRMKHRPVPRATETTQISMWAISSPVVQNIGSVQRRATIGCLYLILRKNTLSRQTIQQFLSYANVYTSEGIHPVLTAGRGKEYWPSRTTNLSITPRRISSVVRKCKTCANEWWKSAPITTS